jgi:hypothetical protein
MSETVPPVPASHPYTPDMSKYTSRHPGAPTNAAFETIRLAQIADLDAVLAGMPAGARGAALLSAFRTRLVNTYTPHDNTHDYRLVLFLHNYMSDQAIAAPQAFVVSP